MRISLPRRPLLVVGACAVLVALAALLFSAGGSRTRSSSEMSIGVPGGGAVPQAAASAAVNPGGAGAAGSGKGSVVAGTTAMQSKDFVRSAVLQLQVADVDSAAAAVIARAEGAGGQLQSDDRSGTDGARSADVIVQVLPARLAGLVDDMSGLGKELDRSIRGDDVTAAHADINARVSALQTSVERLTNFLSHSGSITDLVTLESQLSSRQAELNSTVAQQKALEGEIALSTLTVRLSERPLPVPVRVTHGPAGFASALARGWHVVTVGWRWTVAALGYTLPGLGAALVIATAAAVFWRLVGRRFRGGPLRRSVSASSEATP